jgi:hypothetical protein
MSPGEARRIILLDLSTDEDTVLVEPGFDAHYLESGHLIYGGRDGQVRAALFDPESSEIGEPVVVLDSVKIEPLFGSMVLTADSYGTVVYVKEAPAKSLRSTAGWRSWIDPVDPSWSVPKRATSATRASRGMAATSHSPVMGVHGWSKS